ncbi:MAG TPA: glycosyltransferase family 39 protein [Pirellulales bacterium]|nr:glycosyltransferase family 39 protein [Pirellulales bacterium]
MATLLALQATLLAYGGAAHSPTMDEPSHLAAGLSHWFFGRFDLYKVNTPLIKMAAALPVLAAGPDTDWSRYYEGARAEFVVGDDFAAANGPRLLWLVTLARWGVIPIVLVGGWICWRWARDLYGEAAGLAALVLWCCCPNILAYGQIITADAGAAAVGVAANYMFWRWLKQPTWARAFAAGLVLGLAELTKTTWLVLFALWPALACVWWWKECGTRLLASIRRLFGMKRDERRPATAAGEPKSARILARHLGQVAAILVLPVCFINMGYDFEGTGTRLGDFAFVSRLLAGTGPHGDGLPSVGNRFATSPFARIPVPLPRNYVVGIDIQRCDFERGMPSYLRGEWRPRGWWYWYLYAVALKVPLGALTLLMLAVIARIVLSRRSGNDLAPDGATAVTWRDEMVLLSPLIVVLAVVSSQTGFSRYIRYVLPIFPYAFIWASSVFRDLRRSSFVGWAPPTKGTSHLSESDANGSDSQGPPRESGGQCPPYPSGARRNGPCGQCPPYSRVMTILGVAALAWSVVSSLWYYPHSMSYFNELAGGPLGGPAHLIDAQVEWGQDLLFLKKWLATHPEAQPLGFVYFGPFSPRLAEIKFALPPKGTVQTDDLAEIASVPADLKPGWYAVSVNFLYGYPYFVRDEKGAREWVTCAYYSYFRRFRPAAMAGYGIYIYHLHEDAIRQARSAAWP